MSEEHIENGYMVKCTQAGQRRPYGDSFYEFVVKADKPEDEVKKYCTEHVRKCSLTSEEYLADERAGVKKFADHFRSHYKFRKTGENEYFYQVILPSAH